MDKLFLEQILSTTKMNILVRYRQSIFGFIWVILSPILVLSVQSYTFHHILKIDIDHFHIYLFTGLLPWIFIVQTVEICSTIFIHQGRLMKAFSIHPLIFLFAQILENFFNLLMAFGITLIYFLFFDRFDFFQVLLSFVSLIPLLIGVLGICLLIGTLNVFYRDIRFVVSFVFQILFFLTPIFYPESFVPEKYNFLIDFNLIYYLLKPVRLSMLAPFPDWLFSFGLSFMVASVFLAMGSLTWMWRKNEVQLLT